MSKHSLAAMAVSLMILCGASAGGYAAERAEPPVIHATTLHLPSTTVVRSISGVIYITRAGTAIKNPRVGEVIQSGDLLQITEGSSISLRRQGDTDIKLTRRISEWFKFE